MPTVIENRDRWNHHNWADGGHEWSPGRSPAGTAVLWDRTLFPRIQRFVPASTIVEIGPGFGRWTHYLRGLCDHLILVDVSERCIESCRERFAGDPHVTYVVNDGTSLAEVPDASVDFIFSFDSLVHAEADAITGYLRDAARTLKPGGAAFIHHSNLAAFRDVRTGRLPWFVTRPHWRGASVSADVFSRACDEAGLVCESQELINWLGREWDADRHHLDGSRLPLIDCLSTVMTADATGSGPRRITNHGFVDEWRQAVWMADAYYRRGSDIPGEASGDTAADPGRFHRKLATARDIARRNGWMAVMGLAVTIARTRAQNLASSVHARLAGVANRRFLHRHLLRP